MIRHEHECVFGMLAIESEPVGPCLSKFTLNLTKTQG